MQIDGMLFPFVLLLQCNWATLTSIQRLEARMEHISMQLQHE